MMVLAHGVLSSDSNPSKYLCTLTMALELPLSLALSTKASCASFPLTSARYSVVSCTVNVRSWIITKIVVSIEHFGRLDELATDIVQSLHTIWRSSKSRLLCLWSCG